MTVDVATNRGAPAKLSVEDADHSGARIRVIEHFDSARLHMQIHTVLGDVTRPSPQELVYPTILAFAAPRLSSTQKDTKR